MENTTEKMLRHTIIESPLKRLAIIFIICFTLLLPPAGEAHAATGWSNDGSYWYYRDANGSLVSGWQKIYHSGRYDYYYFKNGRMQTGWLKWDGSWFYLADKTGQGIDFHSSEYGVCRMGWQNIYHSTGWDYYYFKGNGSGRMVTGWLQWDGYWYYLGDSVVGYPFNNPAHGTMLKGVYRIGAHDYVFKDNRLSISFNEALRYPEGAMLKNMSYVEIFNPNGSLLAAGWIDGEGHLYVLGLKSAPKPKDDVSDSPELAITANDEMRTTNPELFLEINALKQAS